MLRVSLEPERLDLGAPEIEVLPLACFEEERRIARLDLGDLVHVPEVVLRVKLHLLLMVRQLQTRERERERQEI